MQIVMIIYQDPRLSQDVFSASQFFHPFLGTPHPPLNALLAGTQTPLLVSKLVHHLIPLRCSIPLIP